jgi:hypothetical protein
MPIIKILPPKPPGPQAGGVSSSSVPALAPAATASASAPCSASRSATTGAIDLTHSELDSDVDDVALASNANKRQAEDDPVANLGRQKLVSSLSSELILDVEALKKTWRSPIYTFFSDDVKIQDHRGRPCHFFSCAAQKCKTSLGGVRRYQDTKDKFSTTNLKQHAIACFGEDAVKNVIKGKDAGTDSGSIFTVFSRQGQQPVNHTHKTHTNAEVM